MAKKKSFALRIDEDLMEAIEQWAADEFRSANGQIEWMLFQMLKQSGRLKRKVQEPENEMEIVSDNSGASLSLAPATNASVTLAPEKDINNEK
jgi:hypothetical protein